VSVVGSSDVDQRYLRLCIELAQRARGRTHPNPLVGAVVVRDGRIVGRGYHQRAGSDHAERMALAEAGEAARGATLYTNIEPCCHHGRTPPCAEAVVEAGIVRVVSSLRDPDARVNGAGFAALRAEGVDVEVGKLAREAAELNAGYLTVKRRGRPFVIGKAALSLDGRMATREGSSQWITGPEARTRAHEWRGRVDAVLVGVNTAIADDPRLTVRHVSAERQPLRIILDPRLRTPVGARMLHEPGGEVIIVAGEGAPHEREEALKASGATVVRVAAGANGRPSPVDALAALVPLEVSSVLIEGGPAVLTAALEVGTIDRLLLFYAPLLIGGEAAPSLWEGLGVDTVDAAPRLHDVSCTRLGPDWLVQGDLHPPGDGLATADSSDES
jgi:diaminohydroxyphosphoribosylaminopyrimidine deaminase/5-amino-6-(5-phosphoribosylamino)uracil reductase